jgi:radical SAM superfamily enzyme YgiQ (UPF0313 family)
MLKELYYKEPVYRPPSEANSLLIQATEGCTYQCTFCIESIERKFKIRSISDIKQDIDTAKQIYADGIRKLFFLAGNAMAMPYARLLEITQYAHSVFPNLNRTSTYAQANDILKKTDIELKSLAATGLKMVYIGIETGNDELLQKIDKRHTANDMVEAFHKCYKAGITPSGTVILGLAGNNKELSKQHMIDTANLINRLSPNNFIKSESLPVWYISCLALMFIPGTPLNKELEEKMFAPLAAEDILLEMKIFLENISDNVQNCVFRSNHASNYLALSGKLCRDRNKLLKQVNENLKRKDDIRPEYFRAL